MEEVDGLIRERRNRDIEKKKKDIKGSVGGRGACSAELKQLITIYSYMVTV